MMTFFGIVASISILGSALVAMLLLISATNEHIKRLDGEK